MLPEEIEVYRDRMWRRDPECRVEDVLAAERFIEDVGFCEALTDSRRPGPSPRSPVPITVSIVPDS